MYINISLSLSVLNELTMDQTKVSDLIISINIFINYRLVAEVIDDVEFCSCESGL